MILIILCDVKVFPGLEVLGFGKLFKGRKTRDEKEAATFLSEWRKKRKRNKKNLINTDLNKEEENISEKKEQNLVNEVSENVACTISPAVDTPPNPMITSIENLNEANEETSHALTKVSIK